MKQQELYYFKEKDIILSENGEVIDLSKMSKAQKKRILKESKMSEVGLITNENKQVGTII